jgi:hypothetical protein
VTSKRRKGFPSETQVKRGDRTVHGGKELAEKLGRNDPCPCGSAKSFQALLPEERLLLTASTATTIDADKVEVIRGELLERQGAGLLSQGWRQVAAGVRSARSPPADLAGVAQGQSSRLLTGRSGFDTLRPHQTIEQTGCSRSASDSRL